MNQIHCYESSHQYVFWKTAVLEILQTIEASLASIFQGFCLDFQKHLFFRTFLSTLNTSECAKVRILVKLIQGVLTRWNYLFL